MEKLSACPLCGNTELQFYLHAVDYTVSHETFRLDKCTSCGMIMTNPRPDQSQLPAYYESEQYISHTNKSSGPLDQVYKLARYFTLRWKYQIVIKSNSSPVKSILDYGCGTGAFLKVCLDNKLEVAGVEPSPKARHIASQLIDNQAFESIGALDRRFDAITLWHVLEHVPDFDESLNQLIARLNPSGTLYIAIPNPKSHDAKKYRAHWAGYDVPRHLWHISPETMKKLLEKHNLKLRKILPMRLDAYYVSLLSEKYAGIPSGATQMLRAIQTAWNSNRSAATTNDYSSLIYIVTT